MAEYSVGIATKNRIYDTAKELFYQKGIHATSFADICEEAKVNKGLITYHFKSKGKLAGLVYQEFIDSMTAAVEDYWQDEELKPTEFATVIELMEFRMMASDSNACRFYYEMQHEEDYVRQTHEIQEQIMRSFAKSAGTKVADGPMRSVCYMTQGTEEELVRMIHDGLLAEPIEDMVARDVATCFFLVGADMQAVQGWIEHGIELAKDVTMTCDSGFHCRVERIV